MLQGLQPFVTVRLFIFLMIKWQCDAMSQKHYIKQWREYKRMTQEALSEKSGVIRNMISLLERNDRRYNQDHLESIAKALDIEPWQLLASPPGEEPEAEPKIEYDEKLLSLVAQLVLEFAEREKRRGYNFTDEGLGEAIVKIYAGIAEYKPETERETRLLVDQRLKLVKF